MKLQLQIDAPAGSRSQQTYDVARLRIGRDPRCGLAFPDEDTYKAVSWEHAELEERPEGVFLRDLGSLNGTYANDAAVQETQVRVGDRISLGRHGPQLLVTAIETSVKPRPVAAEPAPMQPLHRAADQANPSRPAASPSPGGQFHTRIMLQAAIRDQQRLWKAAVAAAAVLVVVVVGGWWYQSSQSAGIAARAETINDQLLHSIVWIVNRELSPPDILSGSGSLVDSDKRLILTNFHVIAGCDEVEIYTPKYRNGKLVVERKEYEADVDGRRGLRGKVVARNEDCDLALVQLDRLWDDAEALSIATESPPPGRRVHSLGNPAASDALWVYTSGVVRQAYYKEWTASMGDFFLDIKSHVVETQSPVNAGDSGGPLVDDRGQLVGVTDGQDTRGQLMSLFIDVSEVHKLLQLTP